MAWGVGRMCHAMSHPCPPIVRSLVPLRSCLFIDRASFHYTVPYGIMAKKQKNESGVRVCLPFFHFFHAFSVGHFVKRHSSTFFLFLRSPFLLMDMLFPVYPVSRIDGRWSMRTRWRSSTPTLGTVSRSPVPPAPRAIG